jgi:hypothetical protein
MYFASSEARNSLDDRPPIAVLGLKSFIVDLLEGVKVFVDQPPIASE